jgi:S-DNA-T family DNA segregation ATPase FtsK/SpoIIIE
MAVEYIDRPPRIQPELPVEEVEVPQPPDEDRGIGQDLITLLLPVISILGFAFVSGSRNPLFILPMGLTMIVTIIVALFRSRRENKELEEKKRAYAELLAEERQEMTRAHNAQRLFYHHNYPDVQTLYEIASRKETSRFGARLWERRITDVDFGVIRLGIGTRPSTVVYTMSESSNPLDDSPLMKDATKLAKDSEFVSDVPITIPLRPYIKDQGPEQTELDEDSKTPGSKDIPARQSIGIFGKNPTNTADFARAILAHFVTFHPSRRGKLGLG